MRFEFSCLRKKLDNWKHGFFIRLEDDEDNVSGPLVYLEILPSLFCNGVLGTAPPGVGTGSSPEYGSN